MTASRLPSRRWPLAAVAALVTLLPATDGASGVAEQHAAVPTGRQAVVGTYQVALAPIGGSGVSGTITVSDTGSALQVRGNATGLNSRKAYTSLLYDVGSLQSGPAACLPNPSAPDPISFDQMQTGNWQPIGSGSRHIAATRRGVAYVEPDRVGTMSIRRIDQSGPTTTLTLVACGSFVEVP